MTVIYDFNLCRLSWILNSIPPLSERTSHNFAELQNKLKYIEQAFEQMENTMALFGNDMVIQRKRLKDTLEFGLICDEIVALDDVDDMIAARDNILCVMRTQEALNT